MTARLLPFTVDGLIWAASTVVLDASRRNQPLSSTSWLAHPPRLRGSRTTWQPSSVSWPACTTRGC